MVVATTTTTATTAALPKRTLATIQRELDEVKSSIFEKINKHFDEYVSSFDISGSSDADLERLRTAVDGIKAQVEGDDADSLLAEVETSSESQEQPPADVLATIKVTDSVIEVLEQICEVDKHLLAYDACIEGSKFLEAASRLANVGIVLRSLAESTTACDSQILQLLKGDYGEKRAHLKSHMEDIWRRVVSFQQPSVGTQHLAAIQVTSPLELAEANNVEINAIDVVNALRILDCWESHAQHFTNMLMVNIITPLCQNHSLCPIVSTNRSITSLTLEDKTPKLKARKPRAKAKVVQEALSVFQSLGMIIEFVVNTIFQGEEDLAAHFGSLVYPQFHDAVVHHLLSKAVPLQASHEGMHEKVKEATLALQEVLVRFSIVQDDNTQLYDYVCKAPLHENNRVRQDLLVKARQILLSDNLNTIRVEHATEKGGLFPPLEQECDGDSAALRTEIYSLPSYHITETTKKFMDLIYTTLQASSSTDSENAVQLFFSVRDMLDLFLSVVPTFHKKALDSAPVVSVALHNDCFYIAHHLLSLGYEHKTSLPEQVQPIATFVDLVPVFRKMGTSHLLRMMKKQQEALSASLDTCQGFADTVTPARFSQVEKGVKQVLHQFEVFVKTCKSVMQPTLFARLAGSLVTLVCARVTTEILSLSDLDSKETTHIHDFVDLLEKKFLSLGIGSMTPEERAKVIPAWSRFVQLKELMDDSMLNIKDKFEAGYWAYTPIELRGMIKAIFSASPKRKSTLADLR